MVLSERRWIGVSVFVAAVGVGLIVSAFATDHWIDCNPVANDTNKNGATGNITFGLFIGKKDINFGLGLREVVIRLDCDTSENVCAYTNSEDSLSSLIAQYKNQTGRETKGVESFGLFSFPIFVTTLVFLVLAIIWGIMAIGFGTFNVFGRPIETITGPAGLYVWNFLAFVFTVAAVGVYLGLYFSQLKVNILSITLQNSGFTSKDLTDLDYSFYLVVGAAGIFLVNLIFLCISGQKCSCSYYRSGEKEVDNGMILY